MISKETATDIALAHREIETAEKLIDDVKNAMDRFDRTELRDSFGRPAGLQLGVPSGESSHRLFNVQHSLALPVIEAHIAQLRASLVALNQKAAAELEVPF